MSKQPETLFKERVQKRLTHEFKDTIYHQKIQQRAIRGTLDLFICLRGWFINWELKTDDGELDSLQAYEMERVRRAGGIAMVVRPATFEKSIEFLKRLPENKL